MCRLFAKAPVGQSPPCRQHLRICIHLARPTRCIGAISLSTVFWTQYSPSPLWALSVTSVHPPSLEECFSLVGLKLPRISRILGRVKLKVYRLSLHWTLKNIPVQDTSQRELQYTSEPVLQRTSEPYTLVLLYTSEPVLLYNSEPVLQYTSELVLLYNSEHMVQ